ncbi:unnamed protein product, partial [Didymodactylos carnosus]
SIEQASEPIGPEIIPTNAKWLPNATTVADGHGQGDSLQQLNYPRGIFVAEDFTVYVDDSENHRIVAWRPNATSGVVVAGGNGQGSQLNQLNEPLDVIVDRETDSLIISDNTNKRVVQWSLKNKTTGKVLIKKIDCVGLAMDDKRFLNVVDRDEHEVRQYRMRETNESDSRADIRNDTNGEHERDDN